MALQYYLTGCCCNLEGSYGIVHSTEVALAEEGAATFVLCVRSRESLRVSPEILVLIKSDSAAGLGDAERRHLVVLARILPVDGE